MIEFIWRNFMKHDDLLYTDDTSDHHNMFMRYIMFGSNGIIYTSLICLILKLFFIVMTYELQIHLYNDMIYILSLVAMIFNEMLPCIFAGGAILVIAFYLLAIYHGMISKINK